MSLCPNIFVRIISVPVSQIVLIFGIPVSQPVCIFSVPSPNLLNKLKPSPKIQK